MNTTPNGGCLTELGWLGAIRVRCGKPAIKDVHFDEGGAVIIDRKCKKCIAPENFERLQEWYGQF